MSEKPISGFFFDLSAHEFIFRDTLPNTPGVSLPEGQHIASFKLVRRKGSYIIIYRRGFSMEGRRIPPMYYVMHVANVAGVPYGQEVARGEGGKCWSEILAKFKELTHD